MTVIRPNSISGVSSITGQGGDISIFRADGTAADVFVNNITSGVITATTFKGAVEGSGANLTNLPAANITGTLPAIDGSNLTGVGLGTDGSANTSGIITATAFVPTTQGSLSHRNMLINGDHRIAQRGTAAVTVDGNARYRSVDRFKSDIDTTGNGDWSHEQSTDVPAGQGFHYSSKITTVTQASQPSASTVNQFYTMLERQDVTHLEWGTSNAKTCTLSFWVKSSITGTYPLNFWIYAGSTQYYWTNYTINSANTWEKKVITLTGPTSGGVVPVTTTTGLRIEWGLGYASGFETGTLNQWTTSDVYRTAAGSVYLPENAGATWYLTGCQFEIGSVATPYEFRRFGEELLLCQRYFCKSYNYDVYSTSTDSADHFDGAVCQRSIASTGSNLIFSPYPVLMRTEPTVTLRGPTAATDASGTIRGSGNTAISVGGFQNTNSPRQLAFYFTSNQSHSFISGHYYADAEL